MPYMATGRNLAYRKNIFLENKGFNSHLKITGGDDDLFINQHSSGKNTVVALEKDSIIFSKAKESWSEYYSQKIRHLAVGKFYKLESRILLAPFMLSWITFWLLAIIGLFTTFWLWFLAGILIRLTSMFIAINAFCKKTGEEIEFMKIPVLDFIFCFYYLVAGFSALITKRIRWKT
jgi:hypothetical protein